MRYVCRTPCYWGDRPETYRWWDYGEIYNGEPRNLVNREINHNFQNMDGQEEVTLDVKELKEMTKKEINKEYELGLSDKEMQFTRKDLILQMVLDKEI